jgi:7tm Chemosensory receptor
VNRSNDLLGFLVISVHGLLFVLICSITDAVLLGLNHLSSSDYIILPTMLLLFISLLTSLTLIASQLERSSRQFASHLALMTSQHSSLTDTQTVNLLPHQVQSTVLTARPLDLYKINHSLLLQMSSVVVTYTIILLQSA